MLPLSKSSFIYALNSFDIFLPNLFHTVSSSDKHSTTVTSTILTTSSVPFLHISSINRQYADILKPASFFCKLFSCNLQSTYPQCKNRIPNRFIKFTDLSIIYFQQKHNSDGSEFKPLLDKTREQKYSSKFTVRLQSCRPQCESSDRPTVQFPDYG